jgi:hypothetical protein
MQLIKLNGSSGTISVCGFEVGKKSARERADVKNAIGSRDP